MSRRASPTLIGAFVVGGLVLAITAAFLLSSGAWLREKTYVVMYFEGSVQGLSVGAPVTFRGVRVGTVTDVSMSIDSDNVVITIPVTAEIAPKHVIHQGAAAGSWPENLRRLVSHGLRAQLEMQSLLTGQLLIELDFQLDKPATFRGSQSLYPEIPTIPAPLDALRAKFEEYPIESILTDVSVILGGIKTLVTDPDFAGTLHGLRQAVDNYGRLAHRLEQQVDPTAELLQRNLATAQQALEKLDALLIRADGTLNTFDQTAEALGKTLQAAQNSLQVAQEALTGAKQLMRDDASWSVSLNAALNEITRAARSLRTLADTLERQPEALLRGKRNSVPQ